MSSIYSSSHPHVLGAAYIHQHVSPVMLLLRARTSVNASRSTGTALLHAIVPDWRKKTSKARSVTAHSFCWKTIRNYVKCTKKCTGVGCRGVERIPVRSHCEGSSFQQLTRRELSAGEKAINFDYLKNLTAPLFSHFFLPLLLFPPPSPSR